MKNLFITLLFMTVTNYLFAQNNKNSNTIEVHLNLLEDNNSQGLKEYALSVSIINHLDKDIYIPDFENFVVIGGIHFYQKEKDGWKEIDPSRHDYYHPLKPPTAQVIINGKTISGEGDVYFYSDENELSKSYKNNNNKLFTHQDSIVKAFYNSSADHHGLPVTVKYGDIPLFLKANQKIENLLVRSLDYLSTKKMDYKISFNSESRDSMRYYQDSIVYSRFSKRKEKLPYPKFIDGYQVFYPKNIISNTIYFTPTYIIKR